MNNIIKSKTIIFITVFFLTFYFIYLFKNKVNQTNKSNLVKPTKIRIAACPTCYKLVKKLDSPKYEIIATKSTAESLSLLKNNHVDMILAGRTLKPDEPQFNHLIIKDGYSFLSDKPMTLYENQLKNYHIYTDLDLNVIKTNFNVGKIFQVNNVYEYLKKGIIITSWENTDYTKAEMIHLLKESGERVTLARRPTLYCSNVCGVEAQEIINIIKNNQKGGENL